MHKSLSVIFKAANSASFFSNFGIKFCILFPKMAISGCLIKKKSRTGISDNFPFLASKFSSYFKLLHFLYFLTPFSFLPCNKQDLFLQFRFQLVLSFRLARFSSEFLECLPVCFQSIHYLSPLLLSSKSYLLYSNLMYFAPKSGFSDELGSMLSNLPKGCLSHKTLMAQSHSSQCKCYLSNIKNGIE